MLYTTTFRHQVQVFQKRYERFLAPGFFVLGFLFDIVTLDRIDSLFSLLQQATYLGIICVALIVELFLVKGHWSLSERQQKWWSWYELLVHFFFGSLLSLYTLFFFLSSSLMTSIVFMTLITALLILNEFERVQRMGLGLRFALLSLCSLSFFSIIVPILVGSVGPWVFFLSLISSLVSFAVLFYLIHRRLNDFGFLRRQALLPVTTVALVYGALYLVKWIPPVPLSLKHIGVYHQVSKGLAPHAADHGGGYQVAYLTKWYQFWKTTSSDFVYRPSDRAYVFVSIFSPTSFRDQVFLRWQTKQGGGWLESDRIPIAITGGRDGGFRGYTYKSRISEGPWRVLVETSDGRELGRTTFTVTADPDPESPRDFKILQL